MITKDKLIKDFNESRKNNEFIPSYDFSLVPDTLNINQKISIICRNKICNEEIGEFETTYKKLIKQKIDVEVLSTCPEIYLNSSLKENKVLFNEFIDKISKIDGVIEKYDFSKVNYVNCKIPVKIFCKKCNKFFWKTPEHFIKDIKNNKNLGCSLCSFREGGLKRANKDWVKKASKIHGEKFNYDKVNYINNYTPVLIKCNKCNTEFLQEPTSHLRSNIACPNCFNEYNKNKDRKNLEDFISEVESIHGKGVFGFSKTEYKNNYTKVTIIDLEKNEEFNISPNKLLQGQGNPLSKMSSGEKFINRYLTENNIQFEYNKTIFNIEGRNSNYIRIDFVLDKYWIEYNGKQHYNLNTKFTTFNTTLENSIDKFKKQIKRDENVRKYCKENGITLIEIPYTYRSYKDISDILERIILKGENPENIIKLPEVEKV